MTRNVARAAGALTIALLTSSCSFLKRQAFAQPVVTVGDVRLGGIGTQGGTINVALDVYNPNNFRLDAEAFNYRVLIDTIQLTEGTIEKRITLLQKDSTRVNLPVPFGFREVLQIGQQLSQRGSVSFRLLGDVKVLTPFGSVKRAFDEKGTYDGVNISILPRK